MKPRHLIPVTLCALLIGYPLSKGPAYRWAGHRDDRCFRAYVKFYEPLTLVAQGWPLFDQMLTAYVYWWAPPLRVD
jgi:hypothetical protein